MTDPQTELTSARADLKSADAHLLELEATIQPPVDLAALQAQHAAELAKVTAAGEVTAGVIDANRDQWRIEMNKVRKLCGIVQPFSAFTTPEQWVVIEGKLKGTR